MSESISDGLAIFNLKNQPLPSGSELTSVGSVTIDSLVSTI